MHGGMQYHSAEAVVEEVVQVSHAKKRARGSMLIRPIPALDWKERSRPLGKERDVTTSQA